jgi:Domain of unknown function (DUF4261)
MPCLYISGLIFASGNLRRENRWGSPPACSRWDTWNSRPRTLPSPPGELRERFHGLANYVLENGPVIRDGDTIGEDANEKIQVVYADSAFGHEGKVMRLVYTPQQKKPWWRFW